MFQIWFLDISVSYNDFKTFLIDVVVVTLTP